MTTQTPSQRIRNAIDRADKWRIDWSDDDMITDLGNIMDDLAESYDLIMSDLRQDYEYVLVKADDARCVLQA